MEELLSLYTEVIVLKENHLLDYPVCGPWSASKSDNLEYILPESKPRELKFSLKIAFTFVAVILKWQVPN